MGTWFDTDGLMRKFGVTKAVPNIAGDYKTYGALRQTELVLDLTTLTSSSVIMSDQTFFPKNAFIESVEIEVSTAATSAGSPTLDVGLVQSDRSTATTPTTASWTTNSVFITAEILASTLDTLGKKIIYTAGVSKAGSGIGLASAQVAYITARANVATYTAGKVIVRINYRAAP